MKIKNNNYNYLNNFVSFNKINEKWDNLFNFILRYFKQYNYSKTIINFVELIYLNKTICIFVFLFVSWFWSNLLLNFIYYFMLVDSMILSLLVLQNNSPNTNSRRLCKNTILLALTRLNVIGSMISLLMIMFIYMEYSKFINRIIFKFLKFILKIIGNIFPPITMLYPDIKLFNFDDPDMTIQSKSKSKSKSKSNPNLNPNLTAKINKNQLKKKYIFKQSDSNSGSDSESDSESESNSESESESDSESDSKSNSPTISKISDGVIKKKFGFVNFPLTNSNNLKKKKIIKKIVKNKKKK